MRKVLLTLLLLAAPVFAQAGPSFEVATIKPSPPLDPQKIAAGQLQIGMNVTKGRVTFGFMPVSALIMQAYKIKPHQVSGPAWLNEDRFDITATFPEGATSEQVPEMMKGLLAERFGLTFHWTSEEKPVYALVVDKDGPKLKEAQEPAPPTANEPKPDAVIGSGENAVSMRRTNQGMSMTTSKTGAVNMTMGPDGNMRMEIGKMTMADLADALTQFVDRPVVDKTELKGTYQVALEMAMADILQIARKSGVMNAMGPEASAALANIPGSSDPSSNSVFASIQKLGLRLDGQKMPVQVFVVDKVLRTPTEN
jgi:uncharacterized protein (TIGR03435 family)